MTAPANRPMPCPRCGTPVAGDFKFCPACAYRLRTNGPESPEPAAPVSRWPQVLLGTLLGALIVATVVVGVNLFHRPSPSRPQTAPNQPTIEGVLSVHDIRRLMCNLPPGQVMWWPDKSNPALQVGVQLDYWTEVLAVEVTRGMYAEFAKACKDPAKVPPFLLTLWRPTPTGDDKTDAADLKRANEYIDVWWNRLEEFRRNHLPDPLPPIRKPLDFVAPLPERYGSLLLVPPSWVYVGGLWEELSWSVPEDTENLPVTEVSWYDAVAFAQWASDELGLKLRLPMYGEWLRAGNAGDADRKYPWGNATLRYACNNLNYWSPTDIPRLLPVNWTYSDASGRTSEGIYAMSGNAREWTRDCIVQETLQNGQPYYRIQEKPVDEERKDPNAPTLGGSFRDGIGDCTVDRESLREKKKIGRWDDVGFRVLRTSTYMD